MNKDNHLISEAYYSQNAHQSNKQEDAESTNIDVDTFIDTIKQSQIKKGNKEFANSFIIGVLSSLVKAALQGESSKDLQSTINRMYETNLES